MILNIENKKFQFEPKYVRYKISAKTKSRLTENSKNKSIFCIFEKTKNRNNKF